MITTTHIRSASRAALAGGLLLVSAASVTAQDAPRDGRWLPWTGCWQSTDATTTLLCVQQANGGVEFLSVGDEGVVSEETIVADGQARSIEDESCDGTATAEFSRDGERVYLREQIECGGVSEVSTGLIAMISPSEWVDIRGSESGNAVWGRTFRRVTDEFATSRGFPDANNDDDMTARMLRWRASEPSDFDDLMEVYERTGTGVARAWVVEQLDPFPIDADALVQLDDEGLPHDVIDVVVARAYPDKFVLAGGGRAYQERAPSGAMAGRSVPVGYGGVAYVGIDPFFANGYWSPWSYRYRSSFGWQYGWDRWGWASPYRDRVVFIERNDDVPGVPGNSRRVRPQPGGGYIAGGGSSGAPLPTTRSTAGGSSAGAAASSGGRSTGRTAKPRRTGGGGGLF